jgi:hypothetical protein
MDMVIKTIHTASDEVNWWLEVIIESYLSKIFEKYPQEFVKQVTWSIGMECVFMFGNSLAKFILGYPHQVPALIFRRKMYEIECVEYQ